jgi:hypothetical protein
MRVWIRFDWLKQALVAGLSEDYNTTGSLKDGFTDQLSHYQLLTKKSDPESKSCEAHCHVISSTFL